MGWLRYDKKKTLLTLNRFSQLRNGLVRGAAVPLAVRFTAAARVVRDRCVILPIQPPIGGCSPCNWNRCIQDWPPGRDLK
jgi:hypothetical protein